MSSEKRPSSRTSIISDNSRKSSSVRTTSTNNRDTVNWGSIDETGMQPISANFASTANSVKFNDLELYGNENNPELRITAEPNKEIEEVIAVNNQLKNRASIPTSFNFLFAHYS